MKKSLFFIGTFLFIAVFSFVSCEEDSEDDGGGSNSLKGIWVRELGASGDETDIAIGVIDGEPENRVYMCELNGSVAGLYKGYLTGNTIVFDAQYGLPNAQITRIGSQVEFYYPSVSVSLPTMYSSGSWRGECTNLEGGGSGEGQATVWIQSDLGCGNITVSIGGQTQVITGYYSGGAPGCSASGCANFSLPPGTYGFTASCSSYDWDGTVTITEDGCYQLKLTL